ncbi:MAG: C25 family cysteine peptidase, partial [Chitinispirillaceae bacterium]|nr:C25 family cysteine peptidase [Chitinispirillaceae bacterium]
IAISTDSLKSELEPLLKVHRERGLKTLFVSIRDIYNRFSWGIADPESIKNFLKYLLARFGKLPKYLLLGGDTTHDLDKQNRNRNIVPTHLSRIPGWGPAADDGYFSLLKGEDLFPDVCVGRFPVQNKEEMKAVVEKTIRYIKEPLTGFWRDNILLLSGIESSFTNFNNEVAEEIIETKMNITRMDADPESYFYKNEFVAPRAIADVINSGVFLINFNGHGGSNIWSDNNFFSYTNLPLLHNGEWNNKGKFPVVFSFTCLTGFFESKDYRSLGEEFLRLKKNGTVAFYGASAYTSQEGNFIMNKIILKKTLNEDALTIGEIINLCEIEMLLRNRNQYIPLVKQYNLLGDPALPWKLTPDTLKFTRVEIDSGNLLYIEGECPPVDSGEVKIMVSSGIDIIERTIVPVKEKKFLTTFKLKNSLRNIAGTIRAYAWNESSEVRGWQQIIKDTVVVGSVKTEPSNLYFGDSILISCSLKGFIADSNPFSSVYCLYAIGEREDPHLSFAGVNMEKKDSLIWTTSSRIPLHFRGNTTANLIVKFRTVVNNKTAESRLFLFPIKGLPDLMFKNNSLSTIWQKDSFYIISEIINCGTEAAPPFSIAYFWKASDGQLDTFDIIYSNDSLLATESKRFLIPIPDTMGALQFESVVNPYLDFREIFTDNNKVAGRINLFFKDVKENSDTILIGNMKIYPYNSLNTTYRIYVTEDTIDKYMPLSTRSKWRSFTNGSPVKWTIVSRPSLSTKDTFICLWEENLSPLSRDTLLSKSDIMVFDTLLKKWRAIGGVRTILENSKMLINAKILFSGIFAVADIDDISPPEINATSYGKSLVNLEYRAKDRPLTIFLADPSEILPSSIELFVNRKKIPSSMYSSISSSGGLQDITLSLYPESMEEVDSLRVVSYDLAGNKGERIFAYLPGSELSIKSFSCHPNPFTAKMNSDGSISKIRFLFLLSDIASSVNLSIYTVSGKKIKSWTLNELIGLNLVEWDGRDEDGFRIANGTYYAKLTAKNDKKRVKKIIRIAKLEGF